MSIIRLSVADPNRFMAPCAVAFMRSAIFLAAPSAFLSSSLSSSHFPVSAAFINANIPADACVPKIFERCFIWSASPMPFIFSPRAFIRLGIVRRRP